MSEVANIYVSYGSYIWVWQNGTLAPMHKNSQLQANSGINFVATARPGARARSKLFAALITLWLKCNVSINEL